ncbi:unnamed protein product [Dovyalis caffra]|uniref:Wall-associated receptor kinase C-terminal domain-containing protein n=1 Tax=Dovyalis caffra TaxID=77055 RepID=A0AAV1SW84_9ROSI|nr:unnamed protein product [Dovyalis caffra]
MKWWPRGREREREAASHWRFAGSLGFGLGAAKAMLNLKEEAMRVEQRVSTLAMLDHDPLLGSASEKCETGVVAPVELYRGENVGIERMLERGFVLNWTASNCSTCEKSGGKCGFDSSTYHFKCFCPDRPHAQYCNSGESF